MSCGDPESFASSATADPYLEQHRPMLIASIKIRNEPAFESGVALAVLPRVGEFILVNDEDSSKCVVLEVVSILHWALKVAPGQTQFKQEKSLVDAELVCKRRMLKDAVEAGA